ncbi:methyltransferase regulatory domain-containing protein [Stieleria varia]|uniref:tRNA (Guanine-N(7)-)-methyltransferase n=1 Tax=Stieleria varia TaxID=2528005 RepID=A0A5C6B521_9BACT|nr:class I SAM-dependent methyltransferase [Stieleria varia]TWU06409.1 hypothetical protein Pla52n_21300 [Stieleria varia]
MATVPEPPVPEPPVPELTSYDHVPYKSFPFRQSHPDRLATIATLHGLTIPKIENSRILEIGCASGGNLLPIADQYPSCQCVGIDLSSHQIAAGNRIREAAGLENVSLRVQDVRELASSDQTFDFVISHGVYSWIPDDAQESLLQACGKLLSPNGVAYVSYNTYPGWHMRGMIRDMMAYHTRSIESPEDRVRKARALLHFLTESVPTEGSPYGLLLKQELGQLQDKEDYYLLHEHLEEFNQPTYFSQFVERAQAWGLQYLGEADYSVMSIDNFSPTVTAMLQNLAADIIETEQYMDFVRNRMFRQTLLCRKECKIERTVSANRLSGLYIASNTRPEGDVDSPDSDEPMTFLAGGSVTKTTNPGVKAALIHLGRTWPKFIPFAELLGIARSLTTGRIALIDTASELRGNDRLGEALLRCYATGHVELSVNPPQFSSVVAQCPDAGLLNRVMAAQRMPITNARHESIHLSDIERRILVMLDGNHDSSQLVAAIVSGVQKNEIVVHDRGICVSDPAAIERLANEVVDEMLKKLARQTLLR